MTYYEALRKALDDATKKSFLPTVMTHGQMLTTIEDITKLLKGSLQDSERIILCADRYELRQRLRRAEDVAKRLMGATKI